MIEMESNFILLLFALVIFSVNTILQKNSQSFSITILLFILFMIFGELVINSSDLTNKNNTNKAIELKLQIQFVAMFFLLIVVGFRYYRILESKKRLVETQDSILK